MFKIDYTIEEADLEPRYKHVHHATSLCFMELARLQYLDSIGFANNKLIEEGLLLVVTAISVEYKRELKPGAISISCEEASAEDKSLSLLQRIYNHKDKLAVEAKLEFKLVSKETQRAIQIPEEFKVKFVEGI